MRPWLIALLLVFACLSGPGLANAQNSTARTLRFGSGAADDHPVVAAMRQLDSLTRQKSNNTLNIEVSTNARSGDDVARTDSLRKGTLEMAMADSSTLVRLNKAIGVINFPFQFDSEQDADAVLDGEFGKKLAQSFEPHGLIVLGWWENGFRNTTTSVRPIVKAQDFSGLKMRVMQNPMLKESFTTLGAEAVPMPFTEVAAALVAKKVDGQENPLVTILASKFYESQSYLSLTRHVYSVWPVMISKKVWDELTAQQRTALTSAVAETTIFQRNAARAASKQAIAELRKRGMQVNEISPAEVSRMRQLLLSVNKKYRAEFGEEWFAALNYARLDVEYAKMKKAQ